MFTCAGSLIGHDQDPGVWTTRAYYRLSYLDCAGLRGGRETRVRVNVLRLRLAGRA